jgi:hypothetical protein
LLALIEERAVAYRDVKPGGASGLLARKVRAIGSGKNTVRIDEYTFDRAVVKEILADLKQAAIEVGDWGKKPDPAVCQVQDLSHLTPEQVLEEARILRETQERLDAVRAGRSDLLMLQAAVPARPKRLIPESGLLTQ